MFSCSALSPYAVVIARDAVCDRRGSGEFLEVLMGIERLFDVVEYRCEQARIKLRSYLLSFPEATVKVKIEKERPTFLGRFHIDSPLPK